MRTLFTGLRNLVLDSAGLGAVERGVFGERFLPKGEWSDRHALVVERSGIGELHFNFERGFRSNGVLPDLVSIEGVTGVRIVDHTVETIDELKSCASKLEAMDLIFLAKRKGIFDISGFLISNEFQPLE